MFPSPYGASVSEVKVKAFKAAKAMLKSFHPLTGQVFQKLKGDFESLVGHETTVSIPLRGKCFRSKMAKGYI